MQLGCRPAAATMRWGVPRRRPPLLPRPAHPPAPTPPLTWTMQCPAKPRRTICSTRTLAQPVLWQQAGTGTRPARRCTAQDGVCRRGDEGWGPRQRWPVRAVFWLEPEAKPPRHPLPAPTHPTPPHARTQAGQGVVQQLPHVAVQDVGGRHAAQVRQAAARAAAAPADAAAAAAVRRGGGAGVGARRGRRGQLATAAAARASAPQQVKRQQLALALPQVCLPQLRPHAAQRLGRVGRQRVARQLRIHRILRQQRREWVVVVRGATSLHAIHELHQLCPTP